MLAPSKGTILLESQLPIIFENKDEPQTIARFQALQQLFQVDEVDGDEFATAVGSFAAEE